MIKVLINGVNGKMGQEVSNLIENLDNFETIAGVDRIDSGDNKYPVYTNLNDIKEIPDVIIDFSVPDASISILRYAVKNHIPIVIATTGFSEEQLTTIKDLSNDTPVFKSANMSYEINLMADIVAKLATQLSDSDIEIVETHHNRKVDAPSGTSLILADSINEALNNEMYYEYNRHDKRKKREKKEIGIHAIRGGTEVGKHTVLFLGDNESFEITHNVTSRSIFAKGALKAAEFIIHKENGLYNMKDFIK